MTSPKTLLTAWNLHAKKELGQHFLSDPSTTDMIVNRSRISSEDVILEIGAGLGALTIPVARVAEKVYAVERDKRLVNLLKTELLVHHLSNVIFIEKDILRLDIEELAKNESQKLIVMGNLPYNISSQIIVQLIHCRSVVERAVIMLQKELAQRITAKPGGKDYGRLTAMLRYCSDIKPIATIKASLFFPKPAIDSAVVEIKFKDIPNPAKDEAFLFKVIKAAFGQRRKTLKNALSGSELHLNPQIATQALESAGIDPSRRAETLSVDEFVRLSDQLNNPTCYL